MKLERLFNGIGLMLLAACFVVALVRVVSREREASDPNLRIVRFAHWQLEPGFREAMDAIAREYMELNPGVRIEQLAIPERTYTTWMRTQLVGGNAPQIIQIGFGVNDEILARYFQPISEHIDAPNPYNRGTPLEAVPWRLTFLDGLNGTGTYNANLMENYGVPQSQFTLRIFYNLRLWREILGDTPTPRTYEEFVAVCEAIETWSRERGRVVIPFYGSRYNSPLLLTRLFGSQTQRLITGGAGLGSMQPSGLDQGIALLDGSFRLRQPEFVSGFELMREVTRFMQDGFLQQGREEATLYFVQEKALMTATGSWDAGSYRKQAPFEVRAFPLPLPSPRHPVYGRHVLGPQNELDSGLNPGWGIVRDTPHADTALDFLKFFSSKRGAELFSSMSGWLPPILGTDLPEAQRDFMPLSDGLPKGLDPSFKEVGPNTGRVFNDVLYRLVSRSGSVEDYIRGVEPHLAQAVQQDLLLQQQNAATYVARQDAQLAAFRLLSAGGTGEEETNRRKIAELIEGQTQLDADNLFIERTLRTHSQR